MSLGLAVALALSHPRHRWYLLEAKKHRLQASLSDVNGFDPYIHNGTPTGVLSALANAFINPGRQPTLGELRRLYRAVRRFWGDLKKREHLSLFGSRGFREVVVASLQIAERLEAPAGHGRHPLRTCAGLAPVASASVRQTR